MGEAYAGSDRDRLGKWQTLGWVMGIVGGALLCLIALTGMDTYGATLTDLPKPREVVDAKRDIQCFLSAEKIASMVLLDGRAVNRRGLNYIALFYNFDGGEKVNLTLLFPIHQGRMSSFPVVYIFGDSLNIKNGATVQVYVDQTGDGICKSIVYEPPSPTEQP